MQEESSMDRKSLSKSSLNQGKLVNNGDCATTGIKSNAKATQNPYQDCGSARGQSHRHRRGHGYRGDRRRQSNAQDRKPVAYRSNHDSQKSSQVERDFPERDENANKKHGRQNLNHLLNFTLTPRHGEHGYGSRRANYPRREPYRPKFNKDHYLQANCQFVVQAKEEYDHHLNDPDVLVNWDFIEQIRLRSNERPSCPICLDPPKAGKMTRCGHIYCWACILQYLSKSHAPWSKCPLCEEFISAADLKSVSVVSYQQPAVGEEITFTLMRRDRNDMIAVPVADHKEGIGRHFPNLSDQHPLAVYSKLLVASEEEVMENIINAERAELLMQLQEEEGEPVAAFIEIALKEFDNRMENMGATAWKPPHLPDPICEQMEELSLINNNSNQEVPVVVYESAFDETLASDTLPESEVSDENTIVESEPVSCPDEQQSRVHVESATKKSNQPKSTFYFYQASDGQMVYLHGLNIDMLVWEYGSLEKCPLTLTGHVVELEETVMTDNVRGKLRYLGHLSLGSTFQVAEVDMKGYVQEHTLLKFNESLKKRYRNRERRARCEEKREKRITEETKRKWPSYSRKTINKSAFYHPTPEQRPSPPAQTAPAAAEASVAEVPDVVPCADGSDAPVMSFARMLREGKTRSSKATKCGGNVETPVLSHSAEQRTRKDTTESEEDWVPPPEYHQSFGNAIAMAMKNAVESEGAPAGLQQDKEGRKKKKKGKAQLLFSTSMSRGK